MSACSGKSAAVAAAQTFTLGLRENCAGCCLGDGIPETTQVVPGLENVLRVQKCKLKFTTEEFKAHIHTYIQVMLWEAGAKLV